MFKKKIMFLVFGFLFSSLTLASDTETGKAKYDKHCQVCHSEKMSPLMKSPTVHKSDKWLPFVKNSILEATENKTTECSGLTKDVKDSKEIKLTDEQIGKLSNEQKACYLLPIAKKGVMSGGVVMPPKGTCTDCTDEQLTSAISFMLSE